MKVSDFHLDSPDWSMSSPAGKMHPVENALLLTDVEMVLQSVKTHLVLEYSLSWVSKCTEVS